jgi:hypothetical protein
MSATEDGISGLMAEYLRSKGVSAVTQISISTPGTRDQPDFQIENGGTFVGEAKWEPDKWEGFGEAHEYGNLTGVNGAFAIAYPEVLKKEGAQARLGEGGVEAVLGGRKYSCAFLHRDGGTDMKQLGLEEIPGWLKSNMEERERPEPDPDEVVSVFRQTAHRLNKRLESAPDENLFRNVLGASPDDEELKKAARKTAGFLLVNQLTFYRVLSSTGRFPEIEPEKLSSPSDIGEYFDSVLEVDYTPVFSFRVSDELPQESLPLLKDAIKTIYAVGPENINHDVLGKVFHELIPFEVRKKIAAYYTMNKSADILAYLSINDEDDRVIDPACGSGSILSSAYLRKKGLHEGGFTEEDHQRYVEDELTGIDAMPFAAHLSCIHLALQAPIYDTDEVNIGIEDSTKLRPGRTISPLSFVLPESEAQRGLSEFSGGELPDMSEETIEAGSVAMDAATGQEMELKTADVVFMNPPFSRQESVAGFAENYKNKLEDRFSRRDNRGQLHGKMNFSSYFMFLADKFLDKGGRIASVLPASILTNSSDGGVREMLLNEYTIEYIITREDEPNFSEDTDRREILLVARKGYEEGAEASYVTLENLDIDPSRIPEVATETEIGEEVDAGDFRLRKAALDEFDVHNMFAPFSVHEPELLELWDGINSSDILSQIEDLDTGLIRGGSSDPWQDGVVSDPTSFQRKGDLWTSVDVDNDVVTAQHKYSGTEVEIPKNNLHPYLLRYSHRQEMDVSDLDEWVIVDTGFNDYDTFSGMGDADDIPQGWKKHVRKASAHTCVQRRCDLTASGTSHLSLYTDEKRLFHRMWCFSDLNETEGKIFTAWFTSGLGILQLIISRLPERGGWTNYRRFSVSRFSTINPSVLNNEEKNTLLEAFGDVKDEKFPSLVERVARLTNRADLEDNEYSQFKRAFDDNIVNSLGDGFEAAVTLDDAVLQVLGKDDADQREYILGEMYPRLLMELVELKEMMD